MSFNTGTQAELLYTLTSSITKNTYTTQAAFTGVLGTNTVCNIPANWLLPGTNPNPLGRSLLLELWGTTATTAAATLAVALGLDPTGVPTTTGQRVGFTGTHTGIDPRVVNYVEVFGTWNASAAGNTTTVQQMFLWGLN